MRSKYDREQFTVGCYIDESAGSADDCNIRTVEFAMAYGFKPGHGWRNPEWLSEVGDQAVDFLNGKETRRGMYWTFENNSLFLTVSVESVKEDCAFVSSKEQECPADHFRGEWLHVNDHGNCTLYVRGARGQDKEIWAIV
jgi:hypothetical protein